MRVMPIYTSCSCTYKKKINIRCFTVNPPKINTVNPPKIKRKKQATLAIFVMSHRSCVQKFGV